jgi:hypothetical protein
MTAEKAASEVAARMPGRLRRELMDMDPPQSKTCAGTVCRAQLESVQTNVTDIGAGYVQLTLADIDPKGTPAQTPHCWRPATPP